MNTAILKKALISEKSFAKASEGKFSFLVDKDATKESIKDVVSGLFSVEVISVNVSNIKGKVKRTKKGVGKRSDLKKAIVTLKKGQKIDLFEIEKEENKKEAKKEDKKTTDNSDTTVKVREKKK